MVTLKEYKTLQKEIQHLKIRILNDDGTSCNVKRVQRHMTE